MLFFTAWYPKAVATGAWCSLGHTRMLLSDLKTEETLNRALSLLMFVQGCHSRAGPSAYISSCYERAPLVLATEMLTNRFLLKPPMNRMAAQWANVTLNSPTKLVTLTVPLDRAVPLRPRLVTFTKQITYLHCWCLFA